MKTKKCNGNTFKIYNTVDFKLGFRGQLDSYNRPILKEVGTTMWYDLLGAESHAFGDWNYINATLKNYKKHCLETPEKAAEYLITLGHKVWVYRDREPELSAHYAKEHNEILTKIYADGVEMFGEEGFLKWFEMCN